MDLKKGIGTGSTIYPRLREMYCRKRIIQVFRRVTDSGKHRARGY